MVRLGTGQIPLWTASTGPQVQAMPWVGQRSLSAVRTASAWTSTYQSHISAIENFINFINKPHKLYRHPEFNPVPPLKGCRGRIGQRKWGIKITPYPKMIRRFWWVRCWSPIAAWTALCANGPTSAGAASRWALLAAGTKVSECQVSIAGRLPKGFWVRAASIRRNGLRFGSFKKVLDFLEQIHFSQSCD